MTEIEIGTEYGKGYEGTYDVRTLAWKEGRELLRKALRSKDPTDYIEELILATVKRVKVLPLIFTKETLAEAPSGLVRRFMDETLRLNDISRQEANFLAT